jgi:hypothetical protein
MLHTRAVIFAHAARFAVRAFAAKPNAQPLLADKVAKAAIGKDNAVATSFVSAFAPLFHQNTVQVTNVVALSGTTALSVGRDMKNDIALRYSVADEGTAVIEVVPQHYKHNRSLVEIQQQDERYLAGRSLAHASGHFLAAVDEMSQTIQTHRLEAAKAAAAASVSNTEGEPKSSGPDTVTGKSGGRKAKLRPKVPVGENASSVYEAYVRAEPVHLLMLSNFCYAHDTKANLWRSTSSYPPTGTKYEFGWVSPLFSTFRLGTDSVGVPEGARVADPGPSSFASFLRDHLSITVVHLPMVPPEPLLNDMDAWNKVVTLPEHRKALEKLELRQWLLYLRYTRMDDSTVRIPEALEQHKIFSKSAELAQQVMSTAGEVLYTEKELNDFTLQRDRESAAREALSLAASAAREAALRAEVERLKKSGSGSS